MRLVERRSARAGGLLQGTVLAVLMLGAARMLRGLGVKQVKIDGPRDGYVTSSTPTLPRRSLPTSVTLTTRDRR